MIFYKIEFGILKGKILGPDILYELTMYKGYSLRSRCL